MTTEEALALLGIEWPRHNKLSCPNHSDSDPSLHLYKGDGGFYCFSCSKGGDALSMLSHFTGQPVGEIMREHGITLGPRGRSRWQQVEDLERRAAEATAAFTVAMRELWGRSALQHIEAHAERVEYLYPDLTRVDDETLPFELQRMVRDLERYYEGELSRHKQGKHTLVTSAHDIQGTGLRVTVPEDGRPGRSSLRGSVPWQSGTVRVEPTSGADESHERLRQAPARLLSP